jgi:hypothetical protein
MLVTINSPLLRTYAMAVSMLICIIFAKFFSGGHNDNLFYELKLKLNL